MSTTSSTVSHARPHDDSVPAETAKELRDAMDPSLPGGLEAASGVSDRLGRPSARKRASSNAHRDTRGYISEVPRGRAGKTTPARCPVSASSNARCGQPGSPRSAVPGALGAETATSEFTRPRTRGWATAEASGKCRTRTPLPIPTRCPISASSNARQPAARGVRKVPNAATAGVR
jgi:hypothetical protein